MALIQPNLTNLNTLETLTWIFSGSTGQIGKGSSASNARRAHTYGQNHPTPRRYRTGQSESAFYQTHSESTQLLIIMSSSITYLTKKSTFRQISEHIPITRARPADKVDPPQVFESEPLHKISFQLTRTLQVQSKSLYLTSFARPSKWSF
jgi:hypothetical protein